LAPDLGANSAEIMIELGYDQGDISRLLEKGVLQG
jgi:crotonobetainyl-CoA:carnitine CoA-transferase CaiB-like acyl-CoA transferase